MWHSREFSRGCVRVGLEAVPVCARATGGAVYSISSKSFALRLGPRCTIFDYKSWRHRGKIVSQLCVLQPLSVTNASTAKLLRRSSSTTYKQKTTKMYKLVRTDCSVPRMVLPHRCDPFLLSVLLSFVQFGYSSLLPASWPSLPPPQESFCRPTPLCTPLPWFTLPPLP